MSRVDWEQVARHLQLLIKITEQQMQEMQKKADIKELIVKEAELLGMLKATMAAHAISSDEVPEEVRKLTGRALRLKNEAIGQVREEMGDVRDKMAAIDQLQHIAGKFGKHVPVSRFVDVKQ